MGNFQSSIGQEADGFTIKSLLQNLLTILGSEMHERGEAVEEVYQEAFSCRSMLEQQPALREAKEYRCLFWNLDALIHEASNMLSNPKHDLFLYLKAIHDFKESMRNSLPRHNISAA